MELGRRPLSYRVIANARRRKTSSVGTPSTLLAPNPRARRRLGGASAISFLGRERSIMLPPPAARWVLRGIAKQAALKDQRYRAPSTLLAPNPRGDAGWGADRSCCRRRPRAGSSGYRQTGGTERSALSCPVDLTRAESSCATPAGRRFGNFVFGARTIDHAAAAGRALGPTGYRQTGGTERSALSCPVDLTRAESSCARARGAGDVGPGSDRHAAGQQSDSRSGRPARRLGGASAISFLGRERSIMLPPPAARWVLRGIAKQAALKDQRYRAPSTLLAPNPRARGARRASDVGPGIDKQAAGQHRDPSIRRPVRRLGGASAISFLGRERSIMLPPPAARWVLRGIAKQAALKDQRYRAPSTLLAPNPRARGARRAGDVGPGSDKQSAEDQRYSAPRSRRILATPAGRRFGNFVFGARTIDHAAAAGRALGPTGYRQTGGTERSALSCPVDLTRAESSCARGAPAATWVRGSTNRQLVSIVTRDLADPRAGWAALRQFRFWGANDRSCCRRRPRAGSYGVSPNRRH